MVHPYFDTNPIRLVVFYIAFAIWAVPELLGSFSQWSRNSSVRKDQSSFIILMITLYLGLFIAFILAFRLPYANIRTLPSIFFGLGIALILVGVALRWYAILVLGAYFTRDIATQPTQKIIQAGPYHLIRHPSYTGSLITMLGVGLALTNWASLVALLSISMVGYLYRISIEERALVDTFGDIYRDYMHRTRRLIPFIW